MRSLTPFLALVLLFPALAGAVPAFEVTPLPELAGATSTATSLTGAGNSPLVTGSSTDAMGTERAVVWTGITVPIEIVALAPLAPTMDSWANTAVRDSGGATTYVAGASTDALGMVKPVYWSRADSESLYSGPMALPTLAGNEGEVLSFHGSGDCGSPGNPDCYTSAGYSTTAGGVEKAVLWSGTPPGPFTLTPLPDYAPGAAGRALGFDYDGFNRFACGWSVDAGDTIPQVWKSVDGAMWTRTPLPLLPGGSAGLGSDAGCGNNRVFVFGWSEIAGGANRHAVRWESADGGQSWMAVDLGAANGLPNSEGFGGMTVGDLGSELWTGGRSSGAAGTETATLWIDDGMTITAHDLSALVVNASPYVLRSITGLVGPSPGDQLTCGTGTLPVSNAGKAPVGPHAFVARVVGGTGAESIPEAGGGLEAAVSPSPFSDATRVSFALPRAGAVRVTVHDVAGRRVATLVEGERPAGRHAAGWSGDGDDGGPVSPGVYFVRVDAVGETAVEKVVRIR